MCQERTANRLHVKRIGNRSALGLLTSDTEDTRKQKGNSFKILVQNLFNLENYLQLNINLVW